VINKISLLILSCDKYHELWNPLFNSYDLFWQNCTYDKYLLSNFKKSDHPNVSTISIGEDISWSSNLIKALLFLKNSYTYVFLSFDDLFLTRDVNDEKLKEVINSFYSVRGSYIKFIVGPKHTKRYNNYFGEIEAGSLYRPTCVFSLWNIEILLSLLSISENAWEFERNSPGRSDHLAGFFVTYNDLFSYRNVVIQGLIHPADAIKYDLHNCIELKKMSKFQHLRFNFRYYTFKIVTTIIPWKYQKFAYEIKKKYFK
jgi:hypothetical protein